MRNKRLIAKMAAIILFAASENASAVCQTAGYTLGFFNGVTNTKVQSITSLNALVAISPTFINGLTVTPEVFYN